MAAVTATFGWCVEGQGVERYVPWNSGVVCGTSRTDDVFRKHFTGVRGRRRVTVALRMQPRSFHPTVRRSRCVRRRR